MLNITDSTTIYIACPAYVATGGPEALHQLCYYMNKLGLRALIAYYAADLSPSKPLTNKRYDKYHCKFIRFSEISDEKENILIAPESHTRCLGQFSNIQKCIWWLSVKFFDGHKESVNGKVYWILKSFVHDMKNFYFNFRSMKTRLQILKYSERCDILNSSDIRYHLVGSKYAYEFLKNKGLNNVEYLVEPISKDFLDAGKYDCTNRKDNSILYNPSKRSWIMTKLSIFRGRKYTFLPLRGYSMEQLISLYRKSKLYIDFGEFGGPERIPKEAVYNGCAIIVADRNAASNDFDVAVGNRYKIKDFNNMSLVEKKIDFVLANYESLSQDFEPFRLKIDNLEKNFLDSIVRIFKHCEPD